MSILGIYATYEVYRIVNDNINAYYKENNKEIIYIIGNGWGAYYLSKKLNKNKFIPIIIAPNKKVLNTPKLINLIEDENANVEFINPFAYIINDEVIDINPISKKIITTSKIIDYNKVIFSIGSESNDYGIDGVKDYTIKIKNKDDVIFLRDKITNKKLNYCIIGSGPTGIELASKLQKHSITINVIEGLDSILPGFTNETKSSITKYLLKNNINLYLQNFVKKINKNSIITNNLDIPFDVVIWTGGVKFNGYEKTKLYYTLKSISNISMRGIIVNDNFSIGNNNDIYCIGDMVANKGPPTAQNAKIQAEWLANYLNNEYNEEFVVKEKGKILHLVNKLYVESKIYNGFLPKYFDYLFDFFN